MSETKFLILGAGPAALSAVEEFRRLNSEDEVKLVNMEDSLPYSPAVLPYLVSGKIKEESLWLRDAKYFEQQNCDFVRGVKAVRLVPEENKVIYQDGTSDHYQKLLITVGSEPLRPAIKGLGGDDSQTFHVLADCRKLISQLTGRKHVIVYGAGLIACELAVGLIERGCQVTLIARSRILRAYFDPDLGDVVGSILVGHGVQVLSPVEVAEAHQSKDKVSLRFSDGKTMSGDVFVICTGVRPRISLTEGTQVKVNRGILVDRYMKTSVDNIYAAGDVAEAYSFFSQENEVIPILPNAIAQGKVAGANMAGGQIEYEGSISTNVFNFFRNTAFSAGLSTAEASGYKVLKDVDKTRGLFKKMVFSGDRLVGASFLNVDVSPGVILYIIRHRLVVDKYRDRLFEDPQDMSRGLVLAAQREPAAV